jgi:prepilin-type processing-associated H-X9-DG protein
MRSSADSGSLQSHLRRPHLPRRNGSTDRGTGRNQAALISRTGLSLIEVLIVIGVLGLLIALLMPAVQQTREGARRIECQSKLRQLCMASHNYETAYQTLPPGRYGSSFSWLTSILPYVEQKNLHQQIDLSVFYADVANQAVYGEVVDLFLCPSESVQPVSRAGLARNSYAGNFGSGVKAHGYNGVFTPPGYKHPLWPQATFVRFRDVTDGVSQTALASEHLMGDYTADRLRVVWNLADPPSTQEQLTSACLNETPRFFEDGNPYGNWAHHGEAWLDASPGVTLYNHVLTPQQPSCLDGTSVQSGVYTAASQHSGGVNVAMADLRVSFISASIDQTAWSAAGSRNGADVGRLGL